jgi:hypothetical protein
MTQKDIELLLVDLCSRLPYGVKVAIEYSEGKYTHIYDLREIDNDTTSELRQQVTIWNYGIYSSVISYPLIDCRPYLRPMSSMTEEENKKLDEIWLKHTIKEGADYLNSIHVDYRGLIPKGLAIEAPDGMYGKEKQ